MTACYGINTPFSSMTECHQRYLAQKIGKSTVVPKWCIFSPATESFEQNVHKAHHQVAHWYSAVSGEPPPLNAVDYGWEADNTNICLIPQNMADVVAYAPEYILKLIRCGCASERPCRGRNSGCMGRQLVCTLFCTCGGGSACSNPFNTKERATDDNVTRDAEDHDLDDNDEVDNN